MAGGLTVCKPVNTIVDVVGGAFGGLLNEVCVQAVGFLTEVVVDGVFCFALARYTIVVGIAPRLLCCAIGTVLEQVVGGVEVTLAVVRHVKSYPNRASYVPRYACHSSSYYLLNIFEHKWESAVA